MTDFENNIINLYGEEGIQWLANLPLLIKQIEIEYGLTNLIPFTNLSFNYVLSGSQGLKPIVLKLGLDNDALKREAFALKVFSEFGSLKVLAKDEGVLLLERAISGISLTSYFPEKENDAIQIACECFKQLHQAPISSSHNFPHINGWLVLLDTIVGIPADYLHKARRLRDELILTSAQPILLHGDLHHDNMLQNGNDWVVIDPKGVIGEPAYDIAAFIRNPMPELLEHNNVSHIIDNRITQCAKILKLSKQRIRDWCFVQTVLAWAWALKDNGDETYFRKLTELFNRYL